MSYSISNPLGLFEPSEWHIQKQSLITLAVKYGHVSDHSY